MANFLKPVGVSTSGYDKAANRQSLVSGEDTIVALWGGGPNGEKLVVYASDGSLFEIVELTESAKNTRKFRLVGTGIGTGKLQAHLGFAGPVWAEMEVQVGMGPPAVVKGSGDLTYDGQTLSWGEVGKTYKATSGLPDTKDDPTDYRFARFSCVKDHGPVPEGRYSFSTKVDPGAYAKDNGQGTCTLAAGEHIQKIPRDVAAGKCEPYWANWGTNRVRLEALDSSTIHACSPERDGFYLHDSTKGYSHGCIEVEGRFFADLFEYAKTSKGKHLSLTIRYRHESTYGGTKKP